MIVKKYAFLYFFFISISLCASDLENNTKGTCKQKDDGCCFTAQVITAKKNNCSQSVIVYNGMSCIFGLTTTAMGYCALSDLGHPARLISEVILTSLFAGLTIFAGYEGYRTGKKQEKYLSA